jgi:integrase
MTQGSKHGSRGRAPAEPIFYCGKREPNLSVRTLSDGTKRFDVRVKKLGRTTLDPEVVKTPTDARRARDEWIRERKREIETAEVGCSDVTLAELREQWQEWAHGPAGTLATTTRTGYAQRLDDFVLPLLGPNTKAASVTAAHLRSMIDQLRAKRSERGKPLSGSTICGTVNAASSLFRLGVRRGHIKANPVRSLERGDRPSQRRARQPRYLTKPEIDRLLAKLRPEARAVAATMAYAALRISEALDLRWCDVNFDSDTLHVQGTKTEGSRADVPMIAPLKAVLLAHRKRHSGVGEALVFRTRNGQRLDRKDVLRSIYTAGDAAGLNPKGVRKVGCHSLRHSCASVLFAAGLPPTKIAAVLRHSTPRVTLMVYAGLADGDRAGLRDDLEAAFR